MIERFKGAVKLSQDNYNALYTNGSLNLPDGTVLTYDPNGTIYITPDLNPSFTHEDKEKVDTIVISRDGTRYLADDGLYKKISPYIDELIGTQEAPINLYANMEYKKLYFIGGYIGIVEDYITIDKPVLAYRISDLDMYLFGAKVDFINNTITFDPSYLSTIKMETSGRIEGYQNGIALKSINGSLATDQIYAPKTSGTIGQILQSNGENQIPTWINLPIAESDTFVSGNAELNFTAEPNAEVAYLKCNTELFIGDEAKDLNLDCNTFQVFTQDGWNWESMISNEDGDNDSARFSFQMGNITLSNTSQGIHLNKALDQITMQASAVRASSTNTDLGTSNIQWNNIYGKTIYQDNKPVANKEDLLLYKHNILIIGTNDNNQTINARLIITNKSTTAINTYSNLIDAITETVEYPINGYIYNSDDTLLGNIVYFNYNVGNYFEFTTPTNNGVERIQLSTSQIQISDNIVVVE